MRISWLLLRRRWILTRCRPTFLITFAVLYVYFTDSLSVNVLIQSSWAQNHLRKLAWPERYSKTTLNRYVFVGGKAIDYVDHCLNGIRGSLMCNADITPDVWQWNDERKRSEVRRDVAHTCRTHEGMEDWEHPMPRLSLDRGQFNESFPDWRIPTQDHLVAAGLGLRTLEHRHQVL